MEKQMRTNKGVALALTLTLAMQLGATGCTTARPMLDERYFGRNGKVMFLPIWNAKQPNKIVMGSTTSVRAWMDKNELNSQNNKKDAEFAKEANEKVHSERRMPFDDTLRAYLKEFDEKPRDVITADDFLGQTAVCAERSVFLAAVLMERGIDAQVIVIQAKTIYGDELIHFIVSAKARERGVGKKMILDPFYGIVEDNPAKYKGKLMEAAGISDFVEFNRIPLLKFEPKYEKYLKNDDAEKELDRDFKKSGAPIREAP